MMVTEIRRIKIISGAAVTLFGLVALLFADPLPVMLEEAAYEPQSKPDNSGFFELETVDFNEIGLRRTRGQNQTGERGAMSLAPEWIDPLVQRQRYSLATDHVRRAEEYVEEQNWSKAIEEMDMALIRNPDDVTLMGKAAMIYAISGDYEQASALFRVFLQHFPDQVVHLISWGGVLLRLHEYDQAIEMLNRALELDPDNVSGRYQLEIYNMVKGIGQPWDQWKNLNMVELNNVVSWLAGEKDELTGLVGDDGYRKLCDMMVGDGTFNQLEQIRDVLGEAMVAQREGEYPRLIRLCAQLIESGVQNIWLRILLAQSCFETGREEKAEDILALLQRLYPEFYPVWYNGGFVALQLGKYDEAERMFKQALAREESGPSLFALACAYAGQEKIDESWIILKQLKRTDPLRLLQWLEGDQEYLNNIKYHPRFYEVGLQGVE